MKHRLRFIDLFAGLGGFHLAAASLGAKCVFAAEIDNELRSVYFKNFGFLPVGDIRSVKPLDIPDHDLLCAGFPCQPFSKAGEQLGLKDLDRGTLIHDVITIIRKKKPRFVLLENVAHFVNHDDGNTYSKIEAALKKLGYDTVVTKLSPHDFGVPQIRERMYMVAQYKGLKNFEWPQKSNKLASILDVLEDHPKDAIPVSSHYLSCLKTWQKFIQRCPKSVQLPSFPIWSMEFGATYPYQSGDITEMPLSSLRKYKGAFGRSLDLKDRESILALIPSHGKRSSFPKWKQDFIRQNRNFFDANHKWIDPWLKEIQEYSSSLQKLEWNCKGGERDIWKYLIQFRPSGVRVKRPTTAPSLVAMTTTQIPIVGWESRYMTIRECARLQSVDSLSYMPSSKSLTHKALGNAVNVTVATKILSNLM